MGARVLVIEDNLANLELMTYLLNAFGYATLIARDGLDGLRIANRESPDLILCDVQLPELSGYEVAQQAKQSTALHDIPLIAVTAFARAIDRAEALAAGFDGYLAKPIDPVTFVQKVEAFLRPELRVAAAIPARSIANPRATSRTQQLTILILDNVQANLDFSASLLEFFGYTVITTVNATEALRRAQQARPDLILSDVCMPERSGYDFIADVKSDQRLSAIPFIFITSTAVTEQDRQRGLALGATKFLFRPIEAQQLLNEVEDCFAGKQNP